MELLHGRIVALGLNRGNRDLGQEVIPFVNFHTPKHRGDKRLERFIQGNQLSAILGGYMTDLSLKIETDSEKVEIDNPTEVFDSLRSQLSFFDEPRRTLICLGDKPFATPTNIREPAMSLCLNTHRNRLPMPSSLDPSPDMDLIALGRARKDEVFA